MSDTILIKDYSAAVKKTFKTSVSQGRFMREVFKAAGNDWFPSTSDQDYAKKICNGTKPINSAMCTGFPRPYHVDELAAYFEKNISDEKISTLTSFLQDISGAIDKKVLSKSLAVQFFYFVDSGGGDKKTDNVVSSTYHQLITGTSNQEALLLPYYRGDKAWVWNDQRTRFYTKGFYEKFDHVWTIRNDGALKWGNRSLVCRNQKELPIKINAYEVKIPDTWPRNDIKVSIQVDTRGIEGTFESIWEMVDSNGNNCFPNYSRMFSFTVAVINPSRLSMEA